MRRSAAYSDEISVGSGTSPSRRVGVIGLAVGEGELQRLGQMVHVIGAVMAEAGEVDALKQRQGLQQHRPLAPGAAGEDVEIAKAAALRRADRRAVFGQVLGRQQPALLLIKATIFLAISPR